MSNPVDRPQLSPEEMRSLCSHAQEVMQRTDAMLKSNSYQDIGQHMSSLENEMGGIEHVEGELAKMLSDLKNSIGAVDLLQKDLKRHWERSKRKYWELRKSTPA